MNFWKNAVLALLLVSCLLACSRFVGRALPAIQV